jgi:guanylate kinase
MMKGAGKGSGKLFVITGPSGSGKTTLAEALLRDKEFRGKVEKSISFTTRPRRPGEKHGKDYFFISEKDFRKGRKDKKILEWTRYLEYYYGTEKRTVDEALKASRSLILCIDVKGARRIRSLYPRDAVLVFVVPPSIKELERRITKRCPGTSPDEVRNRLERAKEEIKEAGWFDYRLVNRDFDVALQRLKKIVRSYVS